MAKTRERHRHVPKKALQMALLWCYFKYGRSIWQVEPVQIAYRSNLNAYGQYKHYIVYDDETGVVSGQIGYVFINPRLHKTLKSAIETVIHEYVHHLQQIDVYEGYFNKGYDYDSHPLEKEAWKVSNRDAQECTNWVLNRLKSHKNGRNRS